MKNEAPIIVVGAGLAGCCLAWQAYFTGVDVLLIDRENSSTPGSSMVAPGLVSPIAGKALNPSWRIDEFYPDMRDFYTRVEDLLQLSIWLELPIHRLFSSEQDVEKYLKKKPQIEKWIADELDASSDPYLAPYGGIVLAHSGRVDLQTFVTKTRAFFQQLGQYEIRHTFPETADYSRPHILSTGAAGLIETNELPHRSAKGEILTIHMPEFPQNSIASRGGWIVPSGKMDHTFYAGASYERDELTYHPTTKGRDRADEIIRSFTSLPYTIVEHYVGIRPIIQRSEPSIGMLRENCFVMNGLGSKGVLYAPKVAEILLTHLTCGRAIDPQLDVKNRLS